MAGIIKRRMFIQLNEPTSSFSEAAVALTPDELFMAWQIENPDVEIVSVTDGSTQFINYISVFYRGLTKDAPWLG